MYGPLFEPILPSNTYVHALDASHNQELHMLKLHVLLLFNNSNTTTGSTFDC